MATADPICALLHVNVQLKGLVEKGDMCHFGENEFAPFSLVQIFADLPPNPPEEIFVV